MTQLEMGDLHGREFAVHQNRFGTPVELVRLSRIKDQRNKRLCQLLAVRNPPIPCIAANAVIPALKAIIGEFLPDFGHPFTLLLGKRLVLLKLFIELCAPRPKHRVWLRFALIFELRHTRSDYLSNRWAAQLK